MMNNHYRNHQNKPKARAIAASQAAEQALLQKIALFATVTLSTLLLLLLINP